MCFNGEEASYASALSLRLRDRLLCLHYVYGWEKEEGEEKKGQETRSSCAHTPPSRALKNEIEKRRPLKKERGAVCEANGKSAD